MLFRSIHHVHSYCLSFEEQAHETLRGFPALSPRNRALNACKTCSARLLEVSTKSKLYALAAEKVVYEAHVEAWGAIRNTSAPDRFMSLTRTIA